MRFKESNTKWKLCHYGNVRESSGPLCLGQPAVPPLGVAVQTVLFKNSAFGVRAETLPFLACFINIFELN